MNTRTLIVCILFLTLLPLHRAHARCEELPSSENFKVSQTLFYSERPPSPPNEAAPIVIGLHGLGHHSLGFSTLGESLPKEWRVFWVQAPLSYRSGFAWYRFRCPEAEDDLKRSTDALIKLAKILQAKYPRAPKPLIFGFSQGGVMTLSALNKAPELWGAGVSFSGYWLSKETPRKQERAKLPPLLIIHGTQDIVVKYQRGESAARLFTEAGYPVAWLDFAGGHRVNQEGLNALITHFQTGARLRSIEDSTLFKK